MTHIRAAVSSADIPPSRDGRDIYLLLNGRYVLCAQPLDQFQRGTIGLSEPQRTWMNVAFTDLVQVEFYDGGAQGGEMLLASADIEVGFASQKKINPNPYDQDDLAKHVISIFQNQMFAPGQRFLMDHSSIPLNLTVKTVDLVHMLSEKTTKLETTSNPLARGVLTSQTSLNFVRDPRSPINLKASINRPAANAIINPDFKFEDLGIGGLDEEFAVIFRRAFASRLFSPTLMEKIGIQHVKGILLFGPPGTGKTLIARRIGKMLNAREPKVINGPEVLNKYVGQSEENIRKLFIDAEKEYKEKGEESGLHIIIFDELDAVCKKRGSGAGGGTGVGDSVVNQLLSKLDGVDQLNNILLIGMTNRKDMIDDALLRPGRLEVHVEISLPDKEGRKAILKIHTQKMRENNILADDVDLEYLAGVTKNFSGAEISGLVKSATSFAFNRHIKVGTMAGVSDNVSEMKVTQIDLQHAHDEITPAFGVSEDSLTSCMDHGIIHYSDKVQHILQQGKSYVQQVAAEGTTPVLSVLIHGLPSVGKTALAAKIALDSGYPFVQVLLSEDMSGMSELTKVQHIAGIFENAYKSKLSCIVLDGIEGMFEWVPVGPRFSNAVFQTLKALLSKRPPTGRKLLILATSSEKAALWELGLWRSFSFNITAPTVRTYGELEGIMKESGAFESALEISSAINGIKQLSESPEVGVGIKTILLAIETAQQRRDKVEYFTNTMSQIISNGPAS